MHAAILPGAAKVISALQADTRRSVRLIFQYAEELIPCGAAAPTAAGEMNEARRAVAALTAPWQHEEDTTGADALQDELRRPLQKLVIRGRGSQALSSSLPMHPVPIAAETMIATQPTTVREIDPRVAAVVSTSQSTRRNGSYNLILDEGKLMGPAQLQDTTVCEQVAHGVELLEWSIAAAPRATAAQGFTLGHDCCGNDP
ncbi:hypothetical protein GH5_02701 [Leishmania sp. Ghana 2012 LV757]|uniref:hypothetical protein n=1 Tax=Leishmania sp. Ghana 2012 LV757 TaxID=2803181 RepID=UPI001B6212F9|nr:hypothetical protein GH5_02701 [Leishmania sp. Ghana 2012 LV757]